jgi:glycosyltransferase involved in cell wall biosynthesis
MDIFDVRPQGETTEWPRIGWTGSVQTHPNDLQETKGAVGKITSTNGLRFNVVGDPEYVATFLSLEKSTPLYGTGWVPVDMFHQAVANFIDIGIVPLEISPFNQAKSALKGLEYAALGVPFVASPTQEYLRMEAYGVGKTAKTPGEWRRHLQRMIDRPAETERIANEARDRIKETFTYRVNAPQWLEAWEKAIDYRKTRP